MILLSASPIDPGRLIEEFRTGVPGAGALASFVGYVRGEDGAVSSLELEHYPGFAEAQIAAFEAAAAERFGLLGILIVHRVGRILPQEPIVVVAAMARHRKEAIQAVDFVMDYLKTDAPLWKKETGPGGPRWIEPRAADRQARAGWNKENETT
jgi:molybdopterin synthase catalytic subunit